MFRKRTRATSNPAQHASPASASASLAATKAFVKDRESNPNLSNAAAAAALRTHVTTLPPVGETITKRMERRNSASSNGSSAMRQRQGGLQRQSSSGSMTERTFRSQSPGRGSPADAQAPPVPSVPKDIPQTSAVHRRASSLEPPLLDGSPVSRGGGGRGVSLDKGSGMRNGGRGQRVTSNLSLVHENEGDNAQRSSVNFSRPMSPASAAKQSLPPKSGWFGGPVVNQEALQSMAPTPRPQMSTGVSSLQLHNAQQSVQSAADRPVKTHQISRGVEGSRLSSGSMRAKPSGTVVESRLYLQSAPRQPPGPVDPKSPDAVFDPSTRTFVHKKDAMALHRELHEEPERPAEHYVAQHVGEHYSDHVPQQHLPPRTPSPVRQPPRLQASPAVQKREQAALPRLDTSSVIRRPEDPPTGVPMHEFNTEPVVTKPQSTPFADEHVQPTEQGNASRKVEAAAQLIPAGVMASPKLTPNQDGSYPRLSKPVAPTPTDTLTGRGRGTMASDRNKSLSPPRNAHFAPVATELAGIKHQPPPRSSSPAKSALKASPSVSRRGSSPVAQNVHLLAKKAPSETSDTASEGGSKMKKRGVRVSFEEVPIVAGTSAYADAETPTTSAGLGASRWSPRTEKEDEFEDFMKPRPALPSFGSIRDRERRSTQEEIPEKVTETVSSTPMSASVGSIKEPLNTSSDHAIADLVVQDYNQKQTATNDPLPPEVTTVEGSGYVSDSSDEAGSSVGMQKHGALDDSSQILPKPEPKSLTAPHDEKSTTPTSITEQVVEVPEIALFPATPSPMEKSEPKFQSMIPGGWDEDVPVVQYDTASRSNADQPTPSIVPSQQPTSLQELITHDDDSSDDNSSIYSDAYEDLTDAEGGFASIDAMVESPVISSPSGLMLSKYAENSSPDSTNSRLRHETVASDGAEAVEKSTQDWNATSEHWSGLNVAQKQPQADEPCVGASSRVRDVTDGAMATPVKATEPRNERKTERASQPRVPSTPQAQVSQPASKPHTPSTTQPQAFQPSSKPLKSVLKKNAIAQPVLPVQAQPHLKKTMRGPPPRDDHATEPQMRSTMRGSSVRDTRSSEPQMRKSMRSGMNPPSREQPSLRTSMRSTNSATSADTGLASSRYNISPPEQKPPRAALQKKHIPAGTIAAKSRPQSMPAISAKPVASVPTYDSDSDASASSFQRARGRRSKNQGGRYTMRASMRQDATPTMRTAAPAAKPIRSISPPGSPTPALRKSMRPSSPNPEPSKTSKFNIRSLSPIGRFRSSKPIEATPPLPTKPERVLGLGKQPKQQPPVAGRTKTAFKSRFADSSDDDDGGRAPRFQSRFADSDDSDYPVDYALPPGLTPVRGIPKKAGEEDGDSTDLEEELDASSTPTPSANKETSDSAVNGASKGHTNGSTNGQGTSLATGSLQDSKHAPLPSFESGTKAKTKRKFFGLGKKKTAATRNTPHPTPHPTTLPPPDIPMPPNNNSAPKDPSPPSTKTKISRPHRHHPRNLKNFSAALHQSGLFPTITTTTTFPSHLFLTTTARGQ
ncbi:hypothetical protein GQ44DRAFT_830155 [Phaeosphaeriaceae sp. PMI808]|nr:hypothetical protein GQ44DRAFT_830155 [Phaeosphaeriaceae sp. PMI808]